MSVTACLAKKIGPSSLLEMGLNSTLKVRRRGATAAYGTLSHVYLLSTGKGHMSVLDDARQDTVSRLLAGLERDAKVFSDWASCLVSSGRQIWIDFG